MDSRWNLWVWLECIGVVSGCCCKEVYRYLRNITYPYSTCISSFFAAENLLLCSFFVLVYVIFVQYRKRCSKNIRDRSKIEITWTWRYNYIDKIKNVRALTTSPETSTHEVPSDVSRKLQPTLRTMMVS